MEPKKGHKTSEFWITAAVAFFALIASTVLFGMGKLSSDEWMKAVSYGTGLLTGVYTISRGVVKGLAGKSGTDGS